MLLTHDCSVVVCIGISPVVDGKKHPPQPCGSPMKCWSFWLAWFAFLDCLLHPGHLLFLIRMHRLMPTIPTLSLVRIAK